MSNPSFREILDELYAQDPTLRDQEQELLRALETISSLKPNERPSPEFQKHLLAQLRVKHRELQDKSTPSFFYRMNSTFPFKTLAIPLGVVAIAALAVTVTPMLKRPTNTILPAQTNNGTLATTPGHVTRLGNAQAFGSLIQPYATGMGGGGGMGGRAEISAVAPSDTSKQSAGGGTASSMIVPPYQLTNLTYVYRGELPTWNAQLDVYKRIKGSSQNTALVQSLAQSTKELVDLSKMNNLELQSFTLNQKEPFGYSISFDLAESVVNINQNYREWPHPEAACRDERCYQNLRLSVKDVPTDDELIRIANTFLKDHGIPTTQYSEPRVNNEWRRFYAETADKSAFYVPDVASVVYPLLIDGKTTYDEGGYPQGLNIGINVREKRVDNVYNLTTNNYQASAYTAEADQARIRDVMAKGGIYGSVYPEAKTSIEVELDTPKMVLQRIWMPRDNGMSDELFIPALRFEVKNPPENMYTPRYVLVPLVKDILDQQRPGDVRIMM